MILAEKITNLRKKMLWSQEDLAQQLDVSRQSVSKWESGQSIPDMDKIVKMSRIFSVSTDYLLRDEVELEELKPQIDAGNANLRRVTMEEADSFMKLRAKHAPKMALGVLMCILSPVLLILLVGLSETGAVHEGLGIGIGLCSMLLMIAYAVAMFIQIGSRSSEYQFMETDAFETEYGVSGVVKRRKADFKERYTKVNTIGVVMCILSAMPLMISGLAEIGNDMVYIYMVCLFLVIVAAAVYGFVSVGVVMGSYDKLLEEGDYTREKKRASGSVQAFNAAYWGFVTAIGLAMMFIPWKYSAYFWIVWPVAAVAYPLFRVLFSTRNDRQ